MTGCKSALYKLPSALLNKTQIFIVVPYWPQPSALVSAEVCGCEEVTWNNGIEYVVEIEFSSYDLQLQNNMPLLSM
ncbi:hypothetical protein J6590_045086 [Homalodisca vitripennis]|nr:hypothetical protein J6590_045086 [Homalodisca vitripennis]